MIRLAQLSGSKYLTSYVTDTIRVELSGINFGCRASTREPDFADQSLAASTVRTPAEVRCAVTWGNTGGNNDLAL